MILIVDAAGNIHSWSDGGLPTPDEGCTAIELTDSQREQFLEVQGTPNGGLVFDGNTITARPLPPPPALPTPSEKLAAVGLTVGDLKVLLGLS